VVGEPGQEGPRLVHLGGVERRRRPASSAASLRPSAHRRPVLDRRAHLLEHVLDPVRRGREPAPVGLPVDLDVGDRLGDRVGAVDSGSEGLHEPAGAVAPDADHGMDQDVDAVALPVSSMPIESTMNGMSSLTISITVCVDRQPWCSGSGL
jgi:hypothetical protein